MDTHPAKPSFVTPKGCDHFSGISLARYL